MQPTPKLDHEEKEEFIGLMREEDPRHYQKFRSQVVAAEKLLSQEKFKEAISKYESIVATQNPNFYFGDVYLGLGTCHAEEGNHGVAAEMFEKGLLFDGEKMALLVSCGISLAKLGEADAAIGHFEKGMRLCLKAKEEAMYAQIAVYCGQLYQDKGDDERAMKVYSNALKLNSEYSQIWFLMGSIASKKKDKQDAIKYYTKATECAHVWPSAYYKLSKLVKDPEQKKQLFMKYVKAQKEME